VLSVKQKIVECAKDIFVSEGYYKTSVDVIATELNISKKTLYKHFASKEKLLGEVINHIISEYNRTIKTILNSDNDSVTKFYMLFEYHSEQMKTVSQKWMKDIRIHTPKMWDKIEKFKYNHIYAIMSQLLEQGKNEKLVTDTQLDLVIESITAVTRHLLSPDFIHYSRYSQTELIKFIFDSHLLGLLTNKGRELYKKKKLKSNIKYNA